MSSASRHICRHLLRATAQPFPRRRCKVTLRRTLQPVTPVRQFTSTNIYRDDSAPATKTQAPKKDEVESVTILEGEELQTPTQPYTVAELNPEDRAHYETLSKKEQAEYMALQNHLKAVMESEELAEVADEEISRIAREIDRNPLSEELRFVEQRDAAKISQGFWQEDEEDEFGQVEDADDEVSDDMITSIAESELEVNREVREYARIAAWELPMLLELVKPFQNPDPLQTPLRFRYTTYMGETHPAQSKVVVDFGVDALASASKLNEQQKVKLVKLLGVRYDPDLNTATMSCEKFENAAQNKRYLGDLVQSLIKEAKDSKETFQDIPLDFRHHKPKEPMVFPENWKITKTHPKAPQPQAMSEPKLTINPKRLYIGNLPNMEGAQAFEEAIRTLFNPLGIEIASVGRLRQPHKGSKRPNDYRFSFVELAKSEDVNKAIMELNGKPSPWSANNILQVEVESKAAPRRQRKEPKVETDEPAADENE